MKYLKEWKLLISSQLMCIQEMLLKNSFSSKSKSLNHLLGYLNLNSTGIIRITIWLRDKLWDLNGKKKKININVLLELSIGSDSILMNMLVMLFGLLSPLLLIDVILLWLRHLTLQWVVHQQVPLVLEKQKPQKISEELSDFLSWCSIAQIRWIRIQWRRFLWDFRNQGLGDVSMNLIEFLLKYYLSCLLKWKLFLTQWKKKSKSFSLWRKVNLHFKIQLVFSLQWIQVMLEGLSFPKTLKPYSDHAQW